MGGEPPVNEDVYTRFAALGVATVYEAAGRTGLIDVPLIQVVPQTSAAGPARTVACGQDDNLAVHAAIERIEPGEVLVLSMPEPRPVRAPRRVVGDPGVRSQGRCGSCRCRGARLRRTRAVRPPDLGPLRAGRRARPRRRPARWMRL